VIEPLLAPELPKPKGGHPRIPDRAALTGIIFVLKSGIPWEMHSLEMGCGSGVTYWRRRGWQKTGGWEQLHWELLDCLGRPTRSTWAGPASTVPRSQPKRGRPNRSVA